MLPLIFLLGTMAVAGFGYNLTQYFQTDYIVKQERSEIVGHNEAYIGHPAIKNFKFNRTHFAMNITLTFKMDFNDSIRVNIQGYKFASNEYRLFPMTFAYNFCEAIYLNSFGFRNLYNKCGHMFQCPIKRGSYSLCNWVPDYTKFPPYIPKGRYMIDIKWLYFNIEILQAQWYTAVTDVTIY